MKPEVVGKYYDEWMEKYQQTYGDVIQAYRPSDVGKLLDYLINSIGITDGEKVLDAGCGVGGPAIHFAQKKDIEVDGLTISAEQQRTAVGKVKESGLENNIQIIQGDYHHLSDYFEPATFDKVLFLESLGHAENPKAVVEEANKVLKPNGIIYIKDFFFKTLKDEQVQQEVDRVIQSMNENYCYNVLDLPELIYNLRNVGFQIDFIKRFDFESDVSVRATFETAFGIDHYENGNEFVPAEWLEIKCLKPENLYY